MTMHIHYRPSDGEILGFENTQAPTDQPGLKVISIDIDGSPDPKLQKINLKTLRLVAKSAKEIAAAGVPTLLDMQMRVVQWLSASDAMMMPDRALSAEARAAWASHRQALRDLSKLPTPAAMLAAWPKPPAPAAPRKRADKKAFRTADLPAMRSAASVRIDAHFNRLAGENLHRDAAHAAKRVVAAGVLSGGHATVEFKAEARLRQITLREFAALIASKPDQPAARELERQKLMRRLGEATTPSQVDRILGSLKG
jgi:hypothetical protein